MKTLKNKNHYSSSEINNKRQRTSNTFLKRLSVRIKVAQKVRASLVEVSKLPVIFCHTCKPHSNVNCDSILVNYLIFCASIEIIKLKIVNIATLFRDVPRELFSRTILDTDTLIHWLNQLQDKDPDSGRNYIFVSSEIAVIAWQSGGALKVKNLASTVLWVETETQTSKKKQRKIERKKS